MKPNWFDMFIYRLFVWRWNPILATRPDLRELMIAWFKTFDVVSEGDKFRVVVTVEKASNESGSD